MRAEKRKRRWLANAREEEALVHQEAALFNELHEHADLTLAEWRGDPVTVACRLFCVGSTVVSPYCVFAAFGTSAAPRVR